MALDVYGCGICIVLPDNLSVPLCHYNSQRLSSVSTWIGSSRCWHTSVNKINSIIQWSDSSVHKNQMLAQTNCQNSNQCNIMIAIYVHLWLSFHSLLIPDWAKRKDWHTKTAIICM